MGLELHEDILRGVRTLVGRDQRLLAAAGAERLRTLNPETS